MNEAREGVEAEIAGAISHSHDDAMLLGFVVVAEWLATDGERYVTRTHGDGMGDVAALPVWQIRGYLTEALRDEWRWGSEAEDDDE